MSEANLKTTYRVLLLWCCGLGAAAQFSKMSLIFPDLEALYAGGQGGVLLGFLVSLISFFGIVFGLVAGILVARTGLRLMLIVGLGFGAGVSLLQASLPPLPVMLGLRLVEGASHLIIVVAAPTLIAQIAAARLLPLAMTLWSTFFGVAYAVTAWFGAPLIANYGLSSIFWVHAGWMLVMAALVLLSIPQDRKPKTAPLQNILNQHYEIYTDPSKSAPALAWFCYTLTFVSILTVIAPFIPAESRALTLGIMPLAGIATSMTVGVTLQRRFSPVTVVVLGFSVSALATIGLWFAPGSPVFCILLFAALGLIQGANFSAIPYLNQEDKARAHAQGAVAQMGNLGNTIGTPIILSLIAVLGFNGIVLFALLAYCAGIAAHLGLARLRATAHH